MQLVSREFFHQQTIIFKAGMVGAELVAPMQQFTTWSSDHIKGGGFLSAFQVAHVLWNAAQMRQEKSKAQEQAINLNMLLQVILISSKLSNL